MSTPSISLILDYDIGPVVRPGITYRNDRVTGLGTTLPTSVSVDDYKQAIIDVLFWIKTVEQVALPKPSVYTEPRNYTLEINRPTVGSHVFELHIGNFNYEIAYASGFITVLEYTSFDINWSEFRFSVNHIEQFVKNIVVAP